MADSPEELEADKYFQASRRAEELNDLEEAMRCIDEAIRLCPSDTVHWSAKGQYLYDMGNYTEAKTAAQKATTINKKNYHAWSILGMINSEVGKYKEAASCYRKSIEIKVNVATYTLLAAVEYEFDVESAILHAQKALEIDPNWDEAKNILTTAVEKRNRAGT